MISRIIPVPQQNARRIALYDLAATRVLCAAEQAELDSLEHRQYMRIWRASRRAEELAQHARIKANLAARAAGTGQRRHVA